MKQLHLFISIAFLVATTVFAQKNTIQEDVYLPNTSELHRLKKHPSRSSFLGDQEVALNLQLDTVITSLAGSHEHYRIFHKGLPLINAQYTIHRFADHVKVRATPIDIIGIQSIPQQNAWVLIEGDLIGAKLDTIRPLHNVPQVTLTSDHLASDYSWSLGVKSQAEQATGNIYLPDPVTTANTSYGGLYQDFDDANTAELEAQLRSAQLEVTLDNGQYLLRNDYVEITEHSAPTVPPATSSTPVFEFNRSESGFEDVNVLYHITTYQLYVQSLGFNNLANYRLACDAHGFNGADQSAFNWSPPQLTFGEGGVDDAEDADVIIHEYGHALAFSAAPNTAFGDERRALDEALGDYLAASYSRVHSEHDWFNVFNWDGHNEFWPGRLAISNDHYPEDLVFNLYADAPLWSATMMDLELNIGRDVTHTLLFESIYSWFPNMTMAQAAQLVIEADSNLNNGSNYAHISHIFWDRGFVDTSYVERPNDIISSLDEEPTRTVNSALRSANPNLVGNPVRIQLNEDVSAVVYDSFGRLIYQKELTTGEQFIDLPTVNAGVYFIQLTSRNGDSSVIKQVFTN